MQRVKGHSFSGFFFNHASGWGRLLMLISYLGSVIKGRVLCTWSLRLVSKNGHGRRASMYILIRTK